MSTEPALSEVAARRPATRIQVVLAGVLLAELVAWWLLRHGMLPTDGLGIVFWVTVSLISTAAVLLALSCRSLVKHRFQFSLRSFLLALGTVGILLGYTGHILQQSRQQRAHAAQLVRAGAQLSYSEESTLGVFLGWLVGREYFEDVVEIKWFCRSVTSQDLEHLQALKSLHRLYLHGRIGDDDLAFLEPLEHLRFLTLDTPDISGAGLSHLKSLPELEELVIGCGYRVKDQQLASLRELRALTRLSLGGTPIGDPALRHVKELAKLRSLDLSYTKITDGGLTHLESLENLEELLLSDTAITNDGLVHLARLRKLRLLGLERTRVTEAGITRLQGSLPRCRMTR